MKLCFSSSETLPKEDYDHDHRNGGFTRLVVEFVKPTCSWTGKNKRKAKQNESQQYQKLNMVKKGTLEDLLLASPDRKENCICNNTGKECRPVKRFFKRICPPFAEDYAHSNKASKAKLESVSMERLLKVEVVDHCGETDVSSVSQLSRSQSGNVRKRVSFRVPSEADVFIFYASDVDSED